ncbi:MAG: TonB-dependent receptor [Balneolaceae bacterium]|nr:TonB-dependent receptor [Balneolaceae bacterium]
MKYKLIAEYYEKDITDLLFNPDLPGTAGGATPPFTNVANIQNQGVDANVTYYGNVNSEFDYTFTVNFTSYKNEIVKITDDIEWFGVDSRRWSEDIVRNEVGQSVSSFYGYKILQILNQSRRN